MATDAITRETWIAAPPDRVWAVITRPEHVGRWFGDAGAEIDLRPGGALRFRWADHGTAFGRVVQVERATLFSFRWAQPRETEPEPGNSTLVEFRLHPDGDGTRLVVTESGFEQLHLTAAEQARYRAGNVEGWRLELGELVAYLASIPA